MLSELLHIKNVICDSQEIISKKQVLEHIGHLVCKQSSACNYVEVLQALIKRERIGSTTLGHGTAVPHARIENLEQPVVCLITLHNAINFHEGEAAAVDIIFSILVPIDANEEQLAILAEIATYLQDATYRDNLRQAKTNEALLQAAIQPPADKGADRVKTNSDHS